MDQTLLVLGGEQRPEEKRRRGGYKPKGCSDVLTEEELKRIVALPDRRTKEGMRDYAILMVFANTPARRGEICSLKTSDLIDEGDKKYLTFRVLKKRSVDPEYNRFDIPAFLYDAIKRSMDLYENRTNDSPMFFTLGKHGGQTPSPITPVALHLLVKKYAKRANINKRISPHSFRASWVTIRADEHDPFTLKEAGRWASINSVMPYARKVQERVRAASLSHSVS